MRALAAGVIVASFMLPGAAHAYWSNGVWVEEAPPAYYAPPPPPVVATPPDYTSASPPPVVYGAPPQATAYGATCYAGVYICQLPQAGPIGAGCSCPGIGAPSYGTIR